MDDQEKQALALVMSILAVDESVALSLVNAGFTSLKEAAYVPIGEFNTVDGLERALIPVLRKRVRKQLLADVIGDAENGT